MAEFNDRVSAGRALARDLVGYGLARPVVLALPRGGVPVAAEVARALNAPLDLVMVRKIGVPEQPELAAAAVADGAHPELVVNEPIAAMAGLDHAAINRLAQAQLAEIARRRAIYLQGRPPVPLAGRTAIVVDDGIATGATMRAALRAVRRAGPARLVLAVPVAPADTLEALRPEVDDLVCPEVPEVFLSVGGHYRHFPQVGDAEVTRLLEAAAAGEE